MAAPAPAPRTGTALAIFLIVSTLVGWSAVPLFLKHFSHSIDAWTSNGWRFGFSALLWAPLLVLGAMRGSLPAGLWRAAVVPSAFNCAGQVCFTWAHYKIDPGLLTFGLRMQIVFVAVGAFLLFPSERRVIRTRSYLLGAATVFGGTLGTILLAPAVVKGSASDVPTGVYLFGVALAIGSGLFFACYALSVRHFMHGVRSTTAFAAISQYTAAAMVMLMFAFGDGASRTDLLGGGTAAMLPFGQLLLLLFSAVIGIALGHVFYYAAIARLGVAISSGVVQLQPILVTAASAVLFGETMTAPQLVCGGVAICGAAVMLSVQHTLARRDRAAAEIEAANAEQA
ncbi:MAG: DMT family transporter [Phycisphaerae bacterium]|nr:DMT family transporter [Phycisphaerae bacterium]